MVVRASITTVIAVVIGVSLAGLACKKRESPPFSSDDARWARVKEAAARTMAVTEMSKLTDLASLMALADKRRGLELSCATPALPGTNKLVGEALAKATSADSPELHAVIYMSRLMRSNGSGLVSMMLGSYVARRVVNWAATHGVTKIKTQPLTAEQERRSVAADVRCVWQRYQAGARKKGGAALRGYLEAIAFTQDEEALRKHQRRAAVYAPEYPALSFAPRGYAKYLAKARGHRKAFNALVQ